MGAIWQSDFKTPRQRNKWEEDELWTRFEINEGRRNAIVKACVLQYVVTSMWPEAVLWSQLGRVSSLLVNEQHCLWEGRIETGVNKDKWWEHQLFQEKEKSYWLLLRGPLSGSSGAFDHITQYHSIAVSRRHLSSLFYVFEHLCFVLFLFSCSQSHKRSQRAKRKRRLNIYSSMILMNICWWRS